MVTRYPLLSKSFLESQVVDMDGYPYFVNPVSDGIPAIDRGLLEEVSKGITDVCTMDCDLILAPEAMGIPLATTLTLRTGVPYSVIRKRRYGLPGEIRLDQTTGYSGSEMYVNGVVDGTRVMIVDDVVSTGGTLRSIVEALRSHGVTVTEIAVVFSKCEDLPSLSLELGVPIHHLLDVRSSSGVPEILGCRQ